MHKRNITLTAMVFAAIITVTFVVFPRLNHSDLLGVFYFPAIFLAVVLSGGSHSPSEAAGWSAFIAYTLIFGVAFVLCYVLLLEIYLLRRVMPHLDEARNDLRLGETHSSIYLRRVGNALKDLELRRRGHFLLEPIEELDLDQEPDVLAAHAISNAGTKSPVKRLMQRLDSHITEAKGDTEGKVMMAKIKEDAHMLFEKARNAKR